MNAVGLKKAPIAFTHKVVPTRHDDNDKEEEAYDAASVDAAALSSVANGNISLLGIGLNLEGLTGMVILAN